MIRSYTQREIIFLAQNPPVTFANKLRKVHKWCIYQKLRCDNVELLINELKPENKRPWSKLKKGIEKIVDILLQMIEVDKDYDENWDLTFETFKNLSENVECDLNKIGKMDCFDFMDICTKSEFGSDVLASFICFLSKLDSNIFEQ